MIFSEYRNGISNLVRLLTEKLMDVKIKSIFSGLLRILVFPCLFPVFFIACGRSAPLNSPYSAVETRENTLYSSFSERPKHLDPARSYSSNEYRFIAQIYEPPFQYHFLKRPYTLVPLTAEKIPTPVYYDREGKMLTGEADEKKIASVVYTVKIKKGIMYQNHPAFAKDISGNYRYHAVTGEDVRDIYELSDFKYSSSRELTAADYVYQIKRMANRQTRSPIFQILANYVDGFREFSKKVQNKIEKIREERRAAGGAAYNQEMFEQEHPIYIDLRSIPLSGATRVDRYTYRITLKKRYPQFVYWMGMPFFAPMPWEADKFYSQGALINRQITLNWFPVGTGPYRMSVNNPDKEMVLVANENFHGERYPSDGFDGAAERGLLDDSGRPLPFIKKAVYKLEKEDIPYWSKFLQGYYDSSGIASDSFDMAIKIGSEGEAGLTESMKEKDIRLSTAVQASTFYMGFNMLDNVVGGYSEERNKLRQAISIAINYEEYIQIFLNGRGIPAQSPVPPGIFGYLNGEKGINPYVYDWKNGRAVRKPVSFAKRLLAEAGYPGGKDKKTGKPLLLYFDTAQSGPGSKSYLDWLRKQFRKIDIQLVIRSTNYNRFQDKMLKGDAQIFQWGWNADYPDPENFLFLLYGPNIKSGKGGENAANYQNPEFDRIFKKMADMENSPKRLLLIERLLRVLQKNSPWIWGLHPKSFALYHNWLKNVYPNLMANNTLKYKRIIPEERFIRQQKWNKPVLWPLWLFAFAGFIFIVPVFFQHFKRNFRKDSL